MCCSNLQFKTITILKFSFVSDISCEKPNFDPTGKLVVYDCPDNFVYGANCSLTCSDGNPVQGSSLITCDKTGEDKKISWTWSGDVAPQCEC